MTFTVFPFFVFGFLMTAMPNWTGEAMPQRAHLYAGLPMALGVSCFSIWGSRPMRASCSRVSRCSSRDG